MEEVTHCPLSPELKVDQVRYFRIWRFKKNEAGQEKSRILDFKVEPTADENDLLRDVGGGDFAIAAVLMNGKCDMKNAKRVSFQAKVKAKYNFDPDSEEEEEEEEEEGEEESDDDDARRAAIRARLAGMGAGPPGMGGGMGGGDPMGGMGGGFGPPVPGVPNNPMQMMMMMMMQQSQAAQAAQAAAAARPPQPMIDPTVLTLLSGRSREDKTETENALHRQIEMLQSRVREQQNDFDDRKRELTREIDSLRGQMLRDGNQHSTDVYDLRRKYQAELEQKDATISELRKEVNESILNEKEANLLLAVGKDGKSSGMDIAAMLPKLAPLLPVLMQAIGGGAGGPPPGMRPPPGMQMPPNMGPPPGMFAPPVISND